MFHIFLKAKWNQKDLVKVDFYLQLNKYLHKKTLFTNFGHIMNCIQLLKYKKIQN